MSDQPRSTAIITGSSTGIGRAIAIMLGAQYKIVVNARADVEGAKRTVDEIQSVGGSAIHVMADLSKQAGVVELFRIVENTYGRATILVNNAGATRSEPLGSWTEEHWLDMLGTNLISCALVSQHFVTQLNNAEGSIVNIASVRGLDRSSRIGAAAYSAAKAGVINLTYALARALAPRITVNSISPGFVETEYMRRADPGLVDAWRRAMPIERFVAPSEIADAVRFITSQRAMTGANIVIDGGWTITQN